MKSIRELDISRYKFIIFDLDGTLIDSAGVWDEIDQKTIAHFCGVIEDLSTINKNREWFLTNNPKGHIYFNYSAWLKEKYNIAETPEQILRMRWDMGCEWYKTCDYKNDAENVIKLLKESGLTLSIATSGVREQVDNAQFKNAIIMAKADFSKYFDLILTQEDVENKKPHPEFYLTVIDYFKANPSECLVFEDHLNGVKSAKKAGIEVVNVYCKHSPTMIEMN